MYVSDEIELTAKQDHDIISSDNVQLIATDDSGNAYEEVVHLNEQPSGTVHSSIISDDSVTPPVYTVSVDCDFEPSHIRIRALNGVSTTGEYDSPEMA